MKKELKAVKKEYPTTRLTDIKEEITEIKIDTTAMIPKEDVVVVVTKDGYIKRTSYRSYTSSNEDDISIKENDYIIHLASIKPSMAVLKEKVTSEIDYKGTENIVRAITFYNPTCFLIYPSTTNVYGKNEKVTTATRTSNPDNNFFK